MAKRRQPRPRRKAGDVFLNLPFTADYERIFIALIAGLTGLRLNPRCVLEIPPQHNRLHRLCALIGECAYSVHDLSHVRLSRGKPRVPRFNMPFELGLAVAIAQAENGRQNAHQFRMLEAEPYRLHIALSDVAGHDPFIHHGRPHGVLEALTNVFAGLDAPSNADMRLIYRKLTQFRRQNLGNSVFEPKPFSQLRVAARELVTSLAAR